MDISRSRFPGFLKLPQEGISILLTLELAMLEVEIQQNRIKEDINNLIIKDHYTRFGNNKTINILDVENIFDENLYFKFMADVHLWLVAWGNVNKLLTTLRKIGLFRL
ncbi:hypothetical protein JW887_03300 [Candidatus Dojkabacteria bacterium]|nr:hypothetical protein [Candidatus Dojkabacteria bacterium]